VGLICLVRKPGVATFRGVVILSGVETLFLLRFDGVPTFFDETVLSFDVFNFFFDGSRESFNDKQYLERLVEQAGKYNINHEAPF
jgi:hypothetical protein